MQNLRLVLHSLLAMALALVVVVAVNQVGGVMAGLMGLPAGGEGRLAWDLGWVCAAGVLATWAAVRLAPAAPRAHAVVLFVIFLVVDVLAVVRLGDEWPRWFSAGALLSLPLQVWLGACWGLRGRRRVPREAAA
jgi:hypothetical protein